MKPVEIQVKIRIAQAEADWWRNILAKKSCNDCMEWDDNACKLAGGVRPPPEVIKVGCDFWSYDEIPF